MTRHMGTVRALGALILGVALISLSGCNPDPTDPDNVSPIALVNDTARTVHVSWCSGDGTNQCQELASLGSIPAGKSHEVHISSYEVVLQLGGGADAIRYVCKEDAEGSRITLSASYPSMAMAYRHC
jgi:hypothetical protein